MYIFATDVCWKHNGYDILHVLLLYAVSASPDAVIISTVAALTVTHSHTPSEQVIVPVSSRLCLTPACSFVYCKILHLAEMKVRLYA